MDAKDKVILKLKKENDELRKKISILSGLVDVATCKSCDNPYLVGYVCECGRDNSYSNAEWKKLISSRAPSTQNKQPSLDNQNGL